MDMNRRKVLLGLGTAAAGSGIVFGSSAFTQVSADRSINIAVDRDSEALLQLNAGNFDAVTENGNGELEIDSNLLSSSDAGFNNNANVEIGDTSDGSFGSGGPNDDGTDAFSVVNRFNSSIDVTIDTSGLTTNANTFRLVLAKDSNAGNRTVANPDGTTSQTFNLSTSDSGNELLVAIEIETDDTGSQADITGNITITAEDAG